LSLPRGQLEFTGTQRFQVLRRLGAGGMGVVYEALDRERRSRVALKTVRDLDGEDLLRLKNEFRALQDLHHPNLVSLGELFEADGRWFFTMELVEGVSFLQYVRPGSGEPVAGTARSDSNVSPSAATWRASPAQKLWDASVAPSAGFDEGRLRDAPGQLARAVCAAHAAGKVHRDVKPSNLLVTPDGRLVLLDFGLVTATAPGDQSSAVHAAGTVEYMAPEQAASLRVGPEADWYGVGVVLHQALTGSVPFRGAPLAVMLTKQTAAPTPPRALCPEVPPDLDALCVALLRADPRARPAAPEVLRCLGAPAEVAPAVSAAVPLPAPPFVGRGAELGALRAAFAASRAGVAVATAGRAGPRTRA
jgi:serine/threonine protein kinase